MRVMISCAVPTGSAFWKTWYQVSTLPATGTCSRASFSTSIGGGVGVAAGVDVGFTPGLAGGFETEGVGVAFGADVEGLGSWSGATINVDTAITTHAASRVMNPPTKGTGVLRYRCYPPVLAGS